MGKSTLVPGIRFHPTDSELIMYYLKRKVLGMKFSVNAPIAEVDIYKFAPWDLPDKSYLKTGDLKWYFFCPIVKKYGKGGRLNRATVYGYWKKTGKDRPVEHNGKVVGTRKTLVFHQGKAPKGERTDWVMHEYKLEEKELADRGIVQDSYVLCEVFQKEGMGPRNGAQYGAPFKEEDWSDEEDETNLPGTGSLCGMSEVAVGGASSSYVLESLCVAPSVESSGLYTPPLGTGSLCGMSEVAVGGASSSYVLESLCVAPSVESSGLYTPTPGTGSLCGMSEVAVGGASSSYVLESVCVGPSVESSELYSPPPGTAHATTTFVHARPEVPSIADANAETVPAFLEAKGAQFARDEEPNGNISTLLDTFHADDAFLPFDGDQTKLPQVADEDNDVALLLESFTEIDNPSSFSFNF